MENYYSLSNINPKKYPIVQNIKNELKKFDKRLQEKKFEEIFSEFEHGMKLCERLRVNAIKKNDEYCANCSFLLKLNFVVIRDIANFWKACENNDYNDAWTHLQDALRRMELSLKFLDDNTKDEIEKSYEYLLFIERLFPYQLFASIATDGNEVKCSICNKSPFDPECDHITENLYWGEIAEHIFVKLGKPNHVLYCSNPKDKRCIVPIKYDKAYPEESPFVLVYNFIIKTERPLKHFKYQISEIEVHSTDNKDIIKIPHYEYFFEE